MSALDGEFGPAAIALTPPLDALFTVVIGESPVTTLPVPANTTFTVHVERRFEDETTGNDWEKWDSAEQIPEPGGDVPEERHGEVTVSSPSWVTVCVGGERRCRVTAGEGETVSVHGERDRSDEVDV